MANIFFYLVITDTSLYSIASFLFFSFFFFNDTATTEIYTLSLHDALPILLLAIVPPLAWRYLRYSQGAWQFSDRRLLPVQTRSEEHTSELQSHLNLVCRLLLEKKKNNIKL